MRPPAEPGAGRPVPSILLIDLGTAWAPVTRHSGGRPDRQRVRRSRGLAAHPSLVMPQREDEQAQQAVYLGVRVLGEPGVHGPGLDDRAPRRGQPAEP